MKTIEIKLLQIVLTALLFFSFTVSISSTETFERSGDDIIYISGFEFQPLQDKVLAGYFTEWGVYGRNYHVKNLHTSGAAEKLTHIIYSFGNVINGECAMGDSYAAIDKYYDAANSVDGVADSWDQGALRGNFNQLLKLKQLHPHIKILWSFGGWTWSGGFGEALQNLATFADSCHDLVYDDRWSGVFDGIDIDWEYPNECGLSCDNSGYNGYGTLMQGLRNRFGNELVTAAIGAGDTKLAAANYGEAAQFLDFYMLMSYDFFGAWNANGPTAPHSPLYSHINNPNNNAHSDYGVQYLKSEGVPAAKITLGVGFYGRGWQGVTESQPGGSATGAADGEYEAGNNTYKVLKQSCPATGVVAGTAYAFCGDEWWSYDTPETIASKMAYVNQEKLGGAFFWEASGDTANGELISAMKGSLD
ncbi:glycoside hydrolase family 18 protein [Marinicella rhabdoformis]|uniref:glycoside hydrolase family 18 protein n=1 Tax=Marinicella rhabdoformis TaxID=2580566 RepID=UPI0012AED087|nr:glycoside hydrolase family 18 protein [Marinicella rhabdoformis]